jgi:hypothetical protein
MTTLRLALDDTGSRNGILLCITFIGLNIVDAWLTGVALGLGSYELNPFLGARFGTSMPVKGLISCLIVTALVLFKRGGLLKPLSLGMLLVCAWNGFAIWSWG